MRRIVLLLGFAALLAAADPDPEFTEDAVTVRGLPLLPLSDLAVGDQAVELHPKGLLGVGWDDNPFGAETQDAEGDAFMRLVAGAELRAQGRGGWRVDADGAIDVQQYTDSPGRDLVGGEARATAKRIGQASTTALSVGWTRDDEPVVLVPDSTPRDRWHADVATVLAGRRSQLELRAAWDALDYLEDGPDFGRDERDYSQFSVAGAWGLIGAESSRMGIEAQAATTRRSASSRISDNNAATARLRWRHAVAERSIIDLRLGASIRSYDEPTAGLASNDDETVTAPSARLLYTWSWEDRSRATVEWSTDLGEAVDENANAARRHAAELWYRHRLRDRLEVIAYGMWQRREDTGSVSGGEAARHNFLQLETGCEYRLRRGIAVRPLASWRRNQTEPGLDSNRLVFSLELAAAF